MTTPEHPVIAALELAERALVNAKGDDMASPSVMNKLTDALPLARKLVAANEALEWLVKRARKESADAPGDKCYYLTFQSYGKNMPPLIKEMIEKEGK